MARSRRRTQWVDALQTSAQLLPGAVAPGTVVDITILSEAEMEELGGGVTLIRVVGHLYCTRTAGTPAVTGCLWLAPAYAGAVFPVDWTQDEFQREANIWSFQYAGNVQSGASRFNIDIRSKRKLGQGKTLQLSLQNHNIAGNDASIFFHLRCLLLLP